MFVVWSACDVVKLTCTERFYVKKRRKHCYFSVLDSYLKAEVILTCVLLRIFETDFYNLTASRFDLFEAFNNPLMAILKLNMTHYCSRKAPVVLQPHTADVRQPFNQNESWKETFKSWSYCRCFKFVTGLRLLLTYNFKPLSLTLKNFPLHLFGNGGPNGLRPLT